MHSSDVGALANLSIFVFEWKPLNNMSGPGLHVAHPSWMRSLLRFSVALCFSFDLEEVPSAEPALALVGWLA